MPRGLHRFHQSRRSHFDGGSTGQYTYDSLNNRVRAAGAQGTYEFVFDVAGRRMSTWGAGNQALAGLTIYSDSGPVTARWGDALLFEHTNWLGTKRMVTDWTGANVEQITSLAFGDGRARTTGDDPDWYDYAGLDGDNEDATEHAQFRNYSPAQGRWLTPDPYYGSYDATNPQSFNRYAYALNNPVSFTDRSGLQVIQVPCTPEQQAAGMTMCFIDNISGNPNSGNGPPSCTPIVNPQGQYEGCTPNGPTSTGNPGSPTGGNPGSGGSTGTNPTNPDPTKPVPVHGPWHYGNNCGPGGTGNPINGVDAGCEAHDICFGGEGADFTNLQSQANFDQLSTGQQQAIQACDQNLCNTMSSVPIPWWNIFERTAAWDINTYFHSGLIPAGARCH